MKVDTYGFMFCMNEGRQSEPADFSADSGRHLALEVWWRAGQYMDEPPPPSGGKHRILTGSIGF
jgi:hypothetical protein